MQQMQSNNSSKLIGHHRCGYENCPICKIAITNSEYWYHIRSHPGHQNDNPPPLQPPPRGNLSREYMTSYSGGRNSDSRKRSFQGGSLANEPAVEVGKEYELEITQISRQGEGIARVQGFVVFVKNGKAGQKAKVKIDRL